jgi:hypothetical protein
MLLTLYGIAGSPPLAPVHLKSGKRELSQAFPRAVLGYHPRQGLGRGYRVVIITLPKLQVQMSWAGDGRCGV